MYVWLGVVWLGVCLAGWFLSGSQWYLDRCKAGRYYAFSTDGHLNGFLSGWGYSISRVRFILFMTNLIVLIPRSRSLSGVISVPWLLDICRFCARVSRVSALRPEWTCLAVHGFKTV